MSISHQPNLEHEDENDLLEFISSNPQPSQPKKFKTIIKNDLVEKDIDIHKTILSEGSCRLSQISDNEYLRIKKNIENEDKSSEYSDESFEEDLESNDVPLAKSETPWIPLPKSLDIQFTDLAKHSQSANFLPNHEKSKTRDLELHLMKKAEKLGMRSSLKLSIKSHNNMNSVLSLAKNSVFSSSIDLNPVRKTQEFLEKENRVLREKLKKINQELNIVLENSIYHSGAKSTSKGRKSLDRSSYSHSDMNIDKRLKIYDSEFQKIKLRYEKVTDPQYLRQLSAEVKKKTEFLSKLDKKIKKLERGQMSRVKQIEGIDSQSLTEDRQNHSQLTEELLKYKDQIAMIELLIEKKTDLHKLNQIKEEKLQEKIDQIKPDPEQIRAPNKDLEEKHEKLKQVFANLEKTKSSSIKQLKVLEYSIKSQKEETLKDLQQIQEKFNQKSENLKTIRAELEQLTTLASSLNLNIFLSPSNSRSKSEVKPHDRSIKLESLNDSGKVKLNRSDIQLSPNSNRNLGKARSEVKLKFKGQIMVEKFMKSVKNVGKSEGLSKRKVENVDEVLSAGRGRTKEGKEDSGSSQSLGIFKQSANPLFKESKSSQEVSEVEAGFGVTEQSERFEEN